MGGASVMHKNEKNCLQCFGRKPESKKPLVEDLSTDLSIQFNSIQFNSIQFILCSSDPGGVFRPRGYRTCQLGYINIYTKEATN